MAPSFEKKPAISLEKIQKTAPELVDLHKAATAALEKTDLLGQRFWMALEVDWSLSMEGFIKRGDVHNLINRTLALSANVDDDGKVPVGFFHTDAIKVQQGLRRKHLNEVEIGSRQATADALVGKVGRHGGTAFAPALLEVEKAFREYQAKGGTDPGLLVFQTDGYPSDSQAVEQIFQRWSGELALHTAFQIFGDENAWINQLDQRGTKATDNVSVTNLGHRPQEVDDQAVYEALIRELPGWLRQITDLGIWSPR